MSTDYYSSQQARAVNIRWEHSHSRKVQPCIVCLRRLGFGIRTIKRLTKASHGHVVRTIHELPEKEHIKTVAMQAGACRRRMTPTKKRTVDGTTAFNAALRKAIRISRALFKCVRSPEERKAKAAEKWRNQYRKDIQLVMRTRLRKRIRKMLGERKATYKTRELLGCDYPAFIRHIESQFTKGMKWSNRNLWHIDHIIPCAAFDLTNEEDIRRCFHYSNMRPMWARDNLTKQAAVKPCQPELLLSLCNSKTYGSLK